MKDETYSVNEICCRFAWVEVAIVIHLCRSLVLQQPDGVKLTAGAIPVVDICEALKEAQENVI